MHGPLYFTKFWRSYVLVFTPLLLMPVALSSGGEGATGEEMKCAYVVMIMAVYWVTEALPLEVTSLIPMVGFPLLGIMSTNEVSINYLKQTNFMFLGGLILALAVEHSGLHLRIALNILVLIGVSPAKLMLGFMLTTGFLSMWISNTATTAMLIPIVDAIAQVMQAHTQGVSVQAQAARQRSSSFTRRVSAIEAKVENEAEFDNMEIINEKQENIKEVEINEDTNARESDPMVESDKKAAPASILKQPNPSAGKRQRAPHIKQTGKSLSTFSVVSQHDGGKISDKRAAEVEKQRNLLLMAVAYSANIGGTGVITGSPPNLVVPEVLDNRFGPATGLTFASWMAFAIPVMSVNLVLSWAWLYFQNWVTEKRRKKKQRAGTDDFEEEVPEAEKERLIKQVMKERHESLGPMTAHELSVFVCFVTVIILWFFRRPLFMPGWGQLFKFKTARGTTTSVGSATPAILMVLVAFGLPSKLQFWPFQSLARAPKSSAALINWKTVQQKLPWGVILLLGGGFALSDACAKSGLSKWIVARMMVLSSLPPWAINLTICTLTAVLTQVASNTATANVLLPILADMALTICVNPIYLIMSAALTSSYAFMLPVATAPNAIVFGASTMTVGDMMKGGIGLNIITLITTAIAINTYAVPIFGLGSFPDWAIPQLPPNITCPADAMQNASMVAY